MIFETQKRNLVNMLSNSTKKVKSFFLYDSFGKDIVVIASLLAFPMAIGTADMIKRHQASKSYDTACEYAAQRIGYPDFKTPNSFEKDVSEKYAKELFGEVNR